jgi:GAF domain-containing protein
MGGGMTGRLLPRERDRRELEVLHRIALTLPRALTVTAVADALASELTLAIDRATECTICSWDIPTDRLEILTTYGRENGFLDEWRGVWYPLTDWPETRAVLVAGGSPRVYRWDDPSLVERVRRQLEEWSWKSWVALPLLVENRSVGLIELVDHRSDRPWSARDIDFCQTVAAQAALAVRNAQLSEELRRSTDHAPLQHPAA